MQQQLQTLKGKNYLRIFLTITLIALAIFCLLMVVRFETYIFIAGIITCLSGLIFIRFPQLIVYNDKFIIQRKFFFNLFSEKTTYEFDKIEKIWFSKGYTFRLNIVALIISGGDASGSSKADQMIIKMANGDKEIINRFGKREKFIHIIKQLNNQCLNTEEW